jgi:basic amino acid/polyamine antiporter, APA family
VRLLWCTQTRGENRMSTLLRTKNIQSLQQDAQEEETSLNRSLGVWNLTAIGIGGIIGVGVFVLTGTAAANQAGPAVAISYVIAGIASVAAVVCYAEFASMIPLSGSAYTYGYAVLGEFLAWIIGWDLLLEYTLVIAVVAIGVSGYLNELLIGVGIEVPAWAAAAPGEAKGAVVNLFAVLLCLIVAAVQIVGIRQSARFNTALVIFKVSLVVFVIVLGAFYVDLGNWVPFMPFGFGGVLAGAGLVFFAVFGEALATVAEEARNPQRDIPLALFLSMIISLTLYVLMALVVTGMQPYQKLDTAAPVSFAFREVGLPFVATIVALAAVIGITTVLFAFMLAAARVFFAISRDGLLPRWFARTHPTYKTPYRPTLIIGVLTALVAGFLPIAEVALLVNIGVLSAYIIVCASIILLRRRNPEIERPFRAPLVPLTPIISIVFSAVLIASLPTTTWVRFGIWMAIGLIVYFAYSRRHSRLASSEVDVDS